ncbi:MAG: ImmA/IrrE family metallo-endopeptidase [Candidatus Marinimicrobia bacterium]|nr:ImmA/IrrE family metallo-endopeptidase [Candidatus Neomarinimicrobiota bacterium]
MENENIQFPFIPEKEIENSTLDLIQHYENHIGEKINYPIPIFEIIEYLGYDVDFRTDGIYEDCDLLGGLRIPDKTVEINENLSEQEGRMNFTAAHEIGHIILHVPVIENEQKILCRKDAGIGGFQKAPEEWQADKFASYLLMPSQAVKKAFFQVRRKPLNVKQKSIYDIFFPKSPHSKAYRLVNHIMRIGQFENVSKMALLNRLIGLGLVRNIQYQKNKTTNKERKSL